MKSGYILLAIGLMFLTACGSEKRELMAPSARDDRADHARGKDAAGKEAGAPAEPVPRKIIYNAQAELVVEDFEKAETELAQLVKEQKGYIASSAVHGSQHSRRSGNWTIRVPVARFDDFLAELAKVGELQRRTLDSDDITDRYHDLKADVKNNQAEEDALRTLLDKSVGKLEDVITIRRELKDIRGKINQQQGQLQRWDKLAELATVTVSIQERKDYVPPTAPSFGTSISRTFHDSIDRMIDVGKGIVLVLVALAPWLPILAVIAFAFWRLVRWASRPIHAPARRTRPISTDDASAAEQP